MNVRPYNVLPGTLGGRSIFLNQSVRPIAIRPYTVGAPDWDEQTLYFRATTAPDVSPSFDPAWSFTDNAVRRALAPVALASDTLGAVANTFATGAVALSVQGVSAPMRGGVVLTAGAISAVFRCREIASDDNIRARFGARVCSVNGAVIRATLLSVGAHGSQAEPGTANASLVFADAEPMSEYTTIPGDRLIIEAGWADVSGTTPSSSITIGSSAATDLALSDGDTTARNGWARISPGA